MLLVILTETNGRGGVPRGHLCSGRWSGVHWAGPHRGTQEPAAAAQMASPPRSWPPAPPPVRAPWEGEGMPRVGYVAALAPLKAWPREVWPETEDLEAVCAVSSGSRQCQVRDRRTGSLGLQTPWSPEREVLLELRAAFWFILQSGFGANGNLEAWPGWGRGTLMCQVWAAGCNNRFPKARARQSQRCQVASVLL